MGMGPKLMSDRMNRYLPANDPNISASERELLAAIDELKARRMRLDTTDAERHLLQQAIYEYNPQVLLLRRKRNIREQYRMPDETATS